jgi:hypothetical protein
VNSGEFHWGLENHGPGLQKMLKDNSGIFR